jgi:hypothetical protein
MEVLKVDALNALLLNSPEDRFYEKAILAPRKFSAEELHELRLDLDRRYAPDTRVDQIEQP